MLTALAQHRAMTRQQLTAVGGQKWSGWGEGTTGYAAPVTDLFSLLIHTLASIFRNRHTLILENLLLRQQLQVALRPKRRLRLRGRDRLFWIVVRRLQPDWRRYLHLVRPETVIRWHRQGWRCYWRWRSRTRLGRPRLSAEVRSLIARMARENPLWGTERIRGELLKLGLVVSARSIRRYRRARPARPPSQAWRTFLRNELAGIWAADLFVVQTLTFKTLYVLFFLQHQRRQLVHFNVTAHPTVAWVWQQLLNATPEASQPRHLIHDRDAVYGADFGQRTARLGIRSVRTPIRAPKANAVAERMVETFRRECLDHLIVLNEDQLWATLREFVGYYNRDRPHRSLRLEAPEVGERPKGGTIRRRPILGGLHHAYEWAA
jgi:transposase InsO family protein